MFYCQFGQNRNCVRAGAGLKPQHAQAMLTRRTCVFAGAAWLAGPSRGEESTLRAAMRQAMAMREQALRNGDQAYGAVVLRGNEVVGAAPSRVVTNTDPTAHAEMEAIRDAARRLRSRDLAGATLVSTSRPCRMCETAAMWAGISRMVYGEQLTDGGPPR